MDVTALVGSFGEKIAPYVAVAWAFDFFLKAVGPLTPWKWDDNIGDILGNFLAKFFPKK